MGSTNEVRHLEALPIVETPDPRDVQYLDDRIYEYNVARTGIADARLLAIILRDDGGEIVAGLYGWTWGRTCEVRTLWVHERWRGRRLGTRLLEAAESEARERGAVQIVLSTHDFQAPAFYRRFGYQTVGQVDDYPMGHRSIHLRKRLRR
ncbi:MAG TPA: GNAT family N-acetyltransferase [Gemmatimonadaceae bacterium]|jgi:ribosomal protein S18 acetylase RimI-like enzyme|nr:GNAT family N-acetyltransferase [Gemmatimonadaceae bacterium]